MSTSISFILVSSFGALCQEIVYWFDLRKSLTPAKSKTLFSSKFYWIITTIMIVVSGIGTWVLFSDDIPEKKSIQFILGAAFPLIFKKAVVISSDTTLGDNALETSKKYLWSLYIK